MAPGIQLLLALASGLSAFIVFVYYQFGKTKKRRAPRARGALPIIGHLHLLGGKELFHQKLTAMAEKYGPAFTISIGSQETLVVSNWEMAKECLTTHDSVFSDRPQQTASKLLGYDSAMFGFAPYGSYWREMRKLVVTGLLSGKQLEMVKHIQATEVQASLKELFRLWVQVQDPKRQLLVNMNRWFGDLTYNAAGRMIAGKRLFGGYADEEGETQKTRKLIKDFVKLFGVFELSDAIPFLRWLDLKGYKEAMRSTAKALDILIGGWLEEHKERRQSKGETKPEHDFMDVILNFLEDAKIPGFDSDTISKATSLFLVLAGSDTTVITLIWTLSLMLNNPRVFKKAQEELDTYVGPDRHVEESDIDNLVYLQAIVKETLRLYTPSPILGLLSTREDCTLSQGYHIPSGTRLMINAWKIHRDERVWPEPNEFMPERFLTSHKGIDVRSPNFEFLPFSSGRRSCPGMSVALHMLHLTLASLLHCYDIAKPSDAGIDMTEGRGLSCWKATPLEVYLTPRLRPQIYGT